MEPHGFQSLELIEGFFTDEQGFGGAAAVFDGVAGGGLLTGFGAGSTFWIVLFVIHKVLSRLAVERFGSASAVLESLRK